MNINDSYNQYVKAILSFVINYHYMYRDGFGKKKKNGEFIK